MASACDTAVRASKRRGAADAHLLSAFSHRRGAVLGQAAVPDKANELGAADAFLPSLLLEGRVVTADALHTQRAHARYLVEGRQAAYLLVVKGNQPSLVQAIDQLPEQAFSPGAPDR